MNLYELQIGKTIRGYNNIKRFSIRITEKEKEFLEKFEKILFDALQLTAGIIMMIIAVFGMWLLVSFLILVA